MSLTDTERLPDGWAWTRMDEDRIELDHVGRTTLVGERLDQARGWRFIYRVERGESVFVDTLGEIAAECSPQSILADTARHIEDGDLPTADLGELLVVENDSIRGREWRM
jgi:hypothetical protein